MQHKKFTKRVLVVIAGLLLLTELIVRVCGITDFPVYDVNDSIGYIPKANQRGKFLNKNQWFFNNRHMPLEANYRTDSNSVLLIGNSIVMGGNPYDQKDKLTSLMQNQVSYRVWPCAIGGWSTLNEIEYMRENKDIVPASQTFLWEYMSGGLSGISTWKGEYVFPTKRPVAATWYLFKRYLLPKLNLGKLNELPPTGKATDRNIQLFDFSLNMLCHNQKREIKGLIWLYPTKMELQKARLGKEWLGERSIIEQLAMKYKIKLIDISTYSDWNEKMYRDDGVHPTVEGNKILANILSKELKNIIF